MNNAINAATARPTATATASTMTRRGGQERQEADPKVQENNRTFAAAMLRKVCQRFEEHKPGEAYVLMGNEEIIKFFEEIWDRHRTITQKELWPWLATLSRRLKADPETRHHLVSFRYNYRRGGREFVYRTWSGTIIKVRESKREFLRAEICIPDHRDLPGRVAWSQVRLAASGLPYGSWYETFSASLADHESKLGARYEFAGLLQALRED